MGLILPKALGGEGTIQIGRGTNLGIDLKWNDRKGKDV
jgi:hypothetical protein